MEIPREKAVISICGEFKSILKNSKISGWLDEQTPRWGIKLATFDVPGIGSTFDRFSFHLGFDYKNQSSKLLLSVENFYQKPNEEKYESSGTFSYVRRKTRKIWRKTDNIGEPLQYTDVEIANMLLDQKIEPGQIEKKILQTIETEQVYS